MLCLDKGQRNEGSCRRAAMPQTCLRRMQACGAAVRARNSLSARGRHAHTQTHKPTWNSSTHSVPGTSSQRMIEKMKDGAHLEPTWNSSTSRCVCRRRSPSSTCAWPGSSNRPRTWASMSLRSRASQAACRCEAEQAKQGRSAVSSTLLRRALPWARCFATSGRA